MGLDQWSLLWYYTPRIITIENPSDMKLVHCVKQFAILPNTSTTIILLNYKQFYSIFSEILMPFISRMSKYNLISFSKVYWLTQIVRLDLWNYLQKSFFSSKTSIILAGVRTQIR